MQAIFFQQRHKWRERMSCDIKPQQLLFSREQFALRPLWQLHHLLLVILRLLLERTEKRSLALLLVVMNARCARDRAINLRKQCGPRHPERIASPRPRSEEHTSELQ